MKEEQGKSQGIDRRTFLKTSAAVIGAATAITGFPAIVRSRRRKSSSVPSSRLPALFLISGSECNGRIKWLSMILMPGAASNPWAGPR